MQILKCSNWLLQFNHSNISDLYFDRKSDLVSKGYVKQTVK